MCRSWQHRVPTRHHFVKPQFEVCILAVLREEADEVEVAICIELLEFEEVTDHFLLSLQLVGPVRILCLRLRLELVIVRCENEWALQP